MEDLVFNWTDRQIYQLIVTTTMEDYLDIKQDAKLSAIYNITNWCAQVSTSRNLFS